MAEHARELARANDVADIVEVIQGSMEDVVLPEKGDSLSFFLFLDWLLLVSENKGELMWLVVIIFDLLRTKHSLRICFLRRGKVIKNLMETRGYHNVC